MIFGLILKRKYFVWNLQYFKLLRSWRMSDSSSDSGPEDRNPPKDDKKRKASSAEKSDKGKKKDPATKRKKEEDSGEDDEGGKILLGSKRFVSVSEFRGKKFVDIREWYGDEDDLKPGKKGISLSKEQFEKLLAVGPKILKKAASDD